MTTDPELVSDAFLVSQRVASGCKARYCSLALIAIAVVALNMLWASEAVADDRADTSALASLPLIVKEDLMYFGAFRVPRGKVGESSFSYGGSVLAFNPKNKSLFVVGHDHEQAVAEISIPGLVKTKRIGELRIAKTLQPFQRILPRIPDLTLQSEAKVGGLLVVDDLIIGTAYEYYDAEGNARDSHFLLSSTVLSAARVEGLFQVGAAGGGYVGGYMAPISPEWQEALGAPYVTGQAALNIIGRTSSGPAAFGFDPARVGAAPTQATALVYYPLEYPLGKIDQANRFFNGTTEITGIVFPPGSRSILFFGSNGTGQIGYGEPEAFDDCRGGKGWHSAGGKYEYQVWAYDALGFLAVAKGRLKPWELKPYDVWPFDFPFPERSKFAGGVAFDAATGRVFIAQTRADQIGYELNPLIHVYKVDHRLTSD